MRTAENMTLYDTIQHVVWTLVAAQLNHWVGSNWTNKNMAQWCFLKCLNTFVGLPLRVTSLARHVQYNTCSWCADQNRSRWQTYSLKLMSSLVNLFWNVLTNRDDSKSSWMVMHVTCHTSLSLTRFPVSLESHLSIRRKSVPPKTF